ncbi:hypothetical protein OBV_32540 [Oscillibacter valericigenes Sjm18-20]|nr:hypothetical protein OBV_32540 [Oscillibacter valericigenes Sjm18-20]
MAPDETARTCRKVGAHKKEAQERVAATPAQKEYAKAYNRLKARKQRDKISVDKWNTAVVKAQDLKDQAECDQLNACDPVSQTELGAAPLSMAILI